jgi:hypothetical protein
MPQLTIISGGQTGADRAALDFALRHGWPHEGWAPRGRRAEDGVIDPRYNLRETPNWEYAERTAWNVRDSDATIVFSAKRVVSGGTSLTLELAQRAGKPVLHLLKGKATPERIAANAAALRGFVSIHDTRRLNIAGPRESQSPGMYAFVLAVLETAFVPAVVSA